jgi:hypothetical protein
MLPHMGRLEQCFFCGHWVPRACQQYKNCNVAKTPYRSVDMKSVQRQQAYRKDYQAFDEYERALVRNDYACHAQQGDMSTHCGRVRRVTRYVEQWDFVTCPDCLRKRRTKAAA